MKYGFIFTKFWKDSVKTRPRRPWIGSDVLLVELFEMQWAAIVRDVYHLREVELNPPRGFLGQQPVP
jgi:hypothetical protein